MEQLTWRRALCKIANLYWGIFYIRRLVQGMPGAVLQPRLFGLS